MSHSNLTRWIENAEARQVLETAQVGRGWTVSESHCVHLGKAIIRVPFWSRQGAAAESLVSAGCHALASFRFPLSRKAV